MRTRKDVRGIDGQQNIHTGKRAVIKTFGLLIHCRTENNIRVTTMLILIMIISAIGLAIITSNLIHASDKPITMTDLKKQSKRHNLKMRISQ